MLLHTNSIHRKPELAMGARNRSRNARHAQEAEAEESSCSSEEEDLNLGSDSEVSDGLPAPTNKDISTPESASLIPARDPMAASRELLYFLYYPVHLTYGNSPPL
jgi:hypothetical protein